MRVGSRLGHAGAMALAGTAGGGPTGGVGGTAGGAGALAAASTSACFTGVGSSEFGFGGGGLGCHAGFKAAGCNLIAISRAICSIRALMSGLVAAVAGLGSGVGLGPPAFSGEALIGSSVAAALGNEVGDADVTWILAHVLSGNLIEG